MENSQTLDLGAAIGNKFAKAMGWTPPHSTGIDVPN